MDFLSIWYSGNVRQACSKNKKPYRHWNSCKNLILLGFLWTLVNVMSVSMSHCWKIINLVNFLHDLSFVALSLTLILYSFILRFKVNERVLLTTKTLLEASLALWPPVEGSILFFFSLVAVKNSWSSGYFALSSGPNCRVRYHFFDACLLIWVFVWSLSSSLRNGTSIDKKILEIKNMFVLIFKDVSNIALRLIL